jgi:predicted nuclease of predicted toxin-antitoxin system
MKFLIDAQLPPALARLIISLGHEALHVEEAGILGATDQAIWNYAIANGQAIITKDEDFKNILLLTSPPTTPVIWVRIGNCSNTALTQWFQPLFPQIQAHLQQGERLIELF